MSASSGRGVFDGNVQVLRRAQQTDAAQLSRNLLLAPRGKLQLPVAFAEFRCTMNSHSNPPKQAAFFPLSGLLYALHCLDPLKAQQE